MKAGYLSTRGRHVNNAAFLVIIPLAFILPYELNTLPAQQATTSISVEALYHSLVHLTSFTLGTFLVVVSFLAYRRDGRTRLLLPATAFWLITLREVATAVNVLLYQAEPHLIGGQIELGHLLDLPIVLLFTLATLKR